MIVTIPNKAIGHTLERIEIDTEYVRLPFAEAQAFITAPGDFVFALMRSVTEREIVRIDIAESVTLEPGVLKINRGQGGSIAAAWPAGSLMLAVTNEDLYSNFLQTLDVRTISFNPNEVLTPRFFGEEVYQDGPAGCERWWKAYNDVDPYWDIITGAPCQDEIYEDIGFDYDLLVPGTIVCYEDRTNETFWEPVGSFGTWNATEQRWEHPSLLGLDVLGTWNQGYRPPLLRIRRPTTQSTTITLENTSGQDLVPGVTKDCGPEGSEFELRWHLYPNDDISRLIVQGSGGGGVWIEGIDFFRCSIETYDSLGADAHIGVQEFDFATARNKDTGSFSDPTGDYIILRADYFSPVYNLYRGFVLFDLSSTALTKLFSVTLRIRVFSHTWDNPYNILYAGVQRSDATAPLGLGDYDNFTGVNFVDTPVPITLNGQYDFVLNADGIQFIKQNLGSTVALCIREYANDFSNVTPPQALNWCQIYSGDNASPDVRPKLIIAGE